MSPMPCMCTNGLAFHRAADCRCRPRPAFTVTDVKSCCPPPSGPWPSAGAASPRFGGTCHGISRDRVYCTAGIIIVHQKPRTFLSAEPLVATDRMGDQASIVAGAINFVKELEHLLQSLEAQKRRRQGCTEPPAPAPFAGLFTFPQYSTAATGVVAGSGDGAGSGGGACAAGARRGVADIEVAVAESHASVKVVTPRRPRQLLRMVVALQCLGLTVLHLNVTTTADQLVLYSLSLKMEDQCRLSSVDDIAAAVNDILGKISDERASRHLLAA
uniref:ACT domain-containing protein n=1 Tax=Zea mays TaxID=4577 RepID=A0A804NXL3_MAIZE